MAPLAAALLVLAAPGVPPHAPTAAAGVGRGFGDALACMGCVAGGVAIVGTGGAAALITAAFVPGSTLVVAGCVYACYAAVSG